MKLLLSGYTRFKENAASVVISDLVSKSDLRTLLSPLFLLILIYLVWFARYPMWQFYGSVELLFLMLILSYSVVLFLSIIFLKKEAKRSLLDALKLRSYGVIPIAIVLAFVFQAAWFTIALTTGGNLEFFPFPSLRKYEGYAVYSIPLAFMLYVVFAVFGAFVEEVTFRAYTQSRIASRYGHVTGVLVASLLFSLQHIHVFQLDWIEQFLQTQFIYVLGFGIFVGYLFIKSKLDVWSAFTFHALTNIFNVSLPVEVSYTFPFATQIVTITSFILMILFLRLLPIEEIL